MYLTPPSNPPSNPPAEKIPSNSWFTSRKHCAGGAASFPAPPPLFLLDILRGSSCNATNKLRQARQRTYQPGNEATNQETKEATSKQASKATTRQSASQAIAGSSSHGLSTATATTENTTTDTNHNDNDSNDNFNLAMVCLVRCVWEHARSN